MMYRCNRACLLRLQHLERQRASLHPKAPKQAVHPKQTLAGKKNPTVRIKSKGDKGFLTKSLSVKEVGTPTSEEQSLPRTRSEGDVETAFSKCVKSYESVRADSNIVSFEVKGVIGQGAFGDILVARCEQNGSIYAIKRIQLEPPESTDLDRQMYLSLIKQEVKALTMNAMISSPFLLALKTWLVMDRHIYIVTDFFNGGDLANLRGEFPDLRMPEHMVQFYCAEMAAAIGFVHSQGMLHCDIKLENFLISYDGHIVLCDFGFVTFDPSTALYGGTLEYMAPERLIDSDDYGTASDWWSLAVCIHKLLFGRHPTWNDEVTRQENVKTIITLDIRVERVDYVCNPYAYTFLCEMLVNNAEHRLGCEPNGFQNVLDHPYLFNFDRTRLLARELIPPAFPNVKGPEDYSCFDLKDELNPDIPKRVFTDRRPAKS